MEDLGTRLARLQRQLRDRESTNEFHIHSNVEAHCVDVVYSTEWVSGQMKDLIHCDGVRLSSIQPTDAVVLKFTVDTSVQPSVANNFFDDER